jgi:hypothetical protein
VIERWERPDARLEEAIDKAVVEGNAATIDWSGPRGLNAGPGDGKAVAPDPKATYEREVFVEAVVVVTGDVRGLAAFDGARLLGE